MGRVSTFLWAVAVSALCIWSSGSALAQPSHQATPTSGPWLTGPLLAPTAHAVPLGHVNWEPYVFVGLGLGHYDRHWDVERASTSTTINVQTEFEIGVLEFAQFEIIPQAFYSFQDGKSAYAFGDLPTQLGFQVCRATWADSLPDLLVTVSEQLPTGNFENLNPDKGGLDATGSGSYRTSLGLNGQKLFHFTGPYYFRLRAMFNYSFPQAVHVEGLNAFGGAPDTEGTVSPGQSYSALLSFEQTLSQNWTFAWDTMFTRSAATTFVGKLGTTPTGGLATMGSDSAMAVSIAPAIEYNWNPSVGVIGGVWLSVAGENSEEFITPTFAVNVYE